MAAKRKQITTSLCALVLFTYIDGKTIVSFQTPQGNTPGTPTTLHEDTTAQTPLAIVKCQPNYNLSNECSCNLRRTEPMNGPFDIWRLNSLADFYAYFVGTSQGTQALDYSKVKTHLIHAVCTDVPPDPADAEVGEAILEVDILPNQQPIIQGYPAVTSQTLNANSDLPIGSTVYQLTVSDAEGDAISYSMKQNPNSGYLTIGPSDGGIRTTVDLRTITTDTIVCTVSVTDGKNIIENFIVTVKLANLNTRPYISNLPATVNVTEDQKTGFGLATLTFGDDTPQNTAALEPDCSVDPVAENYKFTYEVGTRRLKLNTITTGETLLDFETTDKYLITCTVYDGYLYSQGDVLTLNVININEPPVFSASKYYCSMPESKAGVSSCNLGLIVTDPELNPIPVLEIRSGNNSERFRYDRIADKLTFTVDYDVDKGQMPQNGLLTIYAVDSNRATSTANIEVNVQDANDNVCNFGSLQAAQYTIDQGTRLQSLGNFAAIDEDLTSPNNQITYEVVHGQSTSQNYLTVFGNGEIKYVGLIPETEHGKSFSLTIRCKDGGTPSLSATATVQVSYLTTTSTTTTSTTTTTTTATTTTTTQAPEKSIWDDDAFVAVFSVLMVLLGLGLLAAFCYFCVRGNNLRCVDLGPRYQRQTTPRQVRPTDPRTQRRQVEDNFFRSGSSRVSPDYRDHHWRNGDHFEDGLGYEGSRPASKGDIFLTGLNRPRALPAPINRGTF